MLWYLEHIVILLQRDVTKVLAMRDSCCHFCRTLDNAHPYGPLGDYLGAIVASFADVEGIVYLDNVPVHQRAVFNRTNAFGVAEYGALYGVSPCHAACKSSYASIALKSSLCLLRSHANCSCQLLTSMQRTSQ